MTAGRRIALWGNVMSDSYVNLDGLIPRDDFEAKPDQVAAVSATQTQTITELEKGKFFYSVLKKPDFQRETANWEPDTVAELIKSFVNDDLVPAIILWRSPSNDVFVIDGSHRLSSLIAWVQDDYGDGPISRRSRSYSCRGWAQVLVKVPSNQAGRDRARSEKRIRQSFPPTTSNANQDNGYTHCRESIFCPNLASHF